MDMLPNKSSFLMRVELVQEKYGHQTRPSEDVLGRLLYIRLGQVVINEKIQAGEFRIPIHLALGHEAIAVAVRFSMKDGDELFLPHRNIHYHLSSGDSLIRLTDEFLLRPTGGAKGSLGSMNFADPLSGVSYASSILGNNLPVSAGAAWAKRISSARSVVFVVTGDGAIEEGAFYETLIFGKTFHAPLVIVVENNGWSLATSISQRRCEINIQNLAEACGVGYRNLSGDDPLEYISQLSASRDAAICNGRPEIIEVQLKTLGARETLDSVTGEKRVINYHVGGIADLNWNNATSLTQDDPFVGYYEKYGRDLLMDLEKKVQRSLPKLI